mgnify:FL=1
MVTTKNGVWEDIPFTDAFSAFYTVKGNKAKQIRSKEHAQEYFQQPSRGLLRIVQDIPRNDVKNKQLRSYVTAQRKHLETQEDRQDSSIADFSTLSPDALLAEQDHEATRLIHTLKSSEEYKEQIWPASKKENRMQEPTLFSASLYAVPQTNPRLKKVGEDMYKPRGTLVYRVKAYNIS